MVIIYPMHTPLFMLLTLHNIPAPFPWALTLLVNVSRQMQNVSGSPFLNLMPSKTFLKASIDSMSPLCMQQTRSWSRSPGACLLD